MQINLDDEPQEAFDCSGLARTQSTSFQRVSLRQWVSSGQWRAIQAGLHGEEAAWFVEKTHEYADRIAAMPVTYGQQGPSAIAYLHYFHSGSDWYITEKDTEQDQWQAFGYAVLNGDTQNAELGYIPIIELVRLGVELDLHFTPTPLSKIRRGDL